MAPRVADERSQLERWVSFAAGIVAPITVVSALLFYFGYVSARSQYEYFGIDVDTIGLSTQDYVMRSPQPLLVPLLVLTLLAVAGLAPAQRDPSDRTTAERPYAVPALPRSSLLLLGVVGLFAYPLLGDLPYYALVVPGGHRSGRGRPRVPLVPAATRPRARRDPARRCPASCCSAVVTITCAFWATATTAQYSGRGLAKADATNLDRFPVVILDTKEKLHCAHPASRRPRSGRVRADLQLPVPRAPAARGRREPAVPGPAELERLEHHARRTAGQLDPGAVPVPERPAVARGLRRSRG